HKRDLLGRVPRRRHRPPAVLRRAGSVLVASCPPRSMSREALTAQRARAVPNTKSLNGVTSNVMRSAICVLIGDAGCPLYGRVEPVPRDLVVEELASNTEPLGRLGAVSAG